MSHDELPLSHTNDCDKPHDRPQFNVGEFYARKAAWSREVFGPAQNTHGVVAHLRKEVKELRAAIDKPDRQIGDVASICEELADICLLAIDLSWRSGGAAEDFGVPPMVRIVPRDAADHVHMHLGAIDRGTMPPRAGAVVIWDIAFRALGCDGSAILEKFAALQTRTWPDWRTVPADQPIEHVREDSATRRGDDAIAEELVAPLLAERSAMAAAIAKLTAERDDVRKLLDAQPHETVAMAAQRAVSERDLQSKRGDDFLDMLRSIRAALGVGETWTAALLIERAGQLRDDSVAYRGLRGKLVEVVGAAADFADIDLLDLLADRINGPITDAEDDLLEQVQQLEGDVCALKAALHVATRAVQS